MTESCLSSPVPWQSAAGSREPACPLLLHMTPLHAGQPGLTALTEPPRSPCICLNCHSGTQPCQRESATRMRNNLNASSQHSREHQDFYMHLDQTLPCKWTPTSAQISHKYPVWRFWRHLVVRIPFARIQDWSLNPCLIFGAFREN